MNISGSGHIPAGEYNEKVSISGSGKIDGNLRCLGLSCAGSVHGCGEIECAEDVGYPVPHILKKASAPKMPRSAVQHGWMAISRWKTR